MKLTRTERWILANQYRILELLDPEQAQHYREAQTVLEDGYELHYDWITQHIYHDNDTMSAERCTEIGDIFELYAIIQQSYKDLQDKSGIAEQRVVFPGFDGNHETSEMAYARFYSESGGGRYSWLQNEDDFNSHRPMLERYRGMLARWRELESPHSLSADQIRHILGV